MTDSKSARGTFRVCMGLGVALLAMTGVMGALSSFETGPLPAGYRTPIVAFEFAETRDQVEALFGDAGSPERARIAAGMDRLNAVDFAFLVVYGGTLAAFGLAWLRAGVRAGGAVVLLAGVAAVMDAVENVALFRITGALGGEYDGALTLLAWTTWSKWGALALAFGVLSPAMARRGGWWRLPAGLFALPLPLGGLAFVMRAAAAEAFSSSVAVAFLAAFGVAVVEGRREA